MYTVPIWAILPAYNEAQALPPLLDAFSGVRQTTLPNLHVLIIDDGSKDHTASMVEDYAATWIQLISHSTNQGLAQAMRTGIKTALEFANDDDLIVAMDADNTHQPGQLPAMIERINHGADVVIGSRFRPGSEMHGIPLHRQLFSWGVSILFQMMAPIHGVRDFSCGYRLYRARLLHAASQLWQAELITEHGFACMAELLYKLAAVPGTQFAEIPMVLRYDWKPGASKMRVGRNMVDMLRLMWRHRGRRRPIVRIWPSPETLPGSPWARDPRSVGTSAEMNEYRYSPPGR